MLEVAVAMARLVQFLAAALLFGAPLFLLSAARGSASPPGIGWPRLLWPITASFVVAASAVGLVALTASVTGSAALAFDPASLWTVLTGTQSGRALGVRLALAVAAVVAASCLRGRAALAVLTLAGAAIMGSFAWNGHGTAGDGAGGLIHTMADVAHLIAAGVWLGALAVLATLLILPQRAPGETARLHGALAGFSGMGSLAVAALVASGLINSWFLVGPDGLPAVVGTTYGWLLQIKLAAFAGMLALAATNRLVLTPRLGAALGDGVPPVGEIRALKRSVLLEALLGIAVIALVSALGTLTPPAAQT